MPYYQDTEVCPLLSFLSNLDELVVGDEFLIRVLDETLTYEVDQIRL